MQCFDADGVGDAERRGLSLTIEIDSDGSPVYSWVGRPILDSDGRHGQCSSGRPAGIYIYR